MGNPNKGKRGKGEEGNREKASSLLVLLLLAALVLHPVMPLPAAAAAAKEQVLENLQYRMDVWVFTDAARAGITFKSLGGGRYRAEAAAEARGLAKVLSGQRMDNFSTEMAFQDGLLKPLVYREESRRWGKHYLKEYRFDYEKGRLELWQLQEGQGLRRKWETALKKEEPVYDPLSAFYNLRLGGLRRPEEGESIRLRGIPYPRPEEIVVRMGARELEGRKVMVRLFNRAFDEEGAVVFIFFDEKKKWAPTLVWTRILSFGKVLGKILPGSKPLNRTLPEMQAGKQSSGFQVPSSEFGG